MNSAVVENIEDHYIETIDSNQASIPGTKQWSSKIRKRAKQLVKDIDTGYLELAKILYQVYDAPIDGDSNRGAVYTSWGHKSFAQYAEEELGIHRRRAERLRKIGYALEVELVELDPAMKNRLVELGSSKLRELVSVLSVNNAEAWIKLAEGMSYPNVRAAIRKAKEIADIEKLKAKVEDNEADIESIDDDVDSVEESSTSPADPPEIETLGGSVEEEDGASFEANKQPSKPDPVEPDKLVYLHFPLYPEQELNVKTALRKAGDICGSDKKGHRLDLICLDFLANNDIVPSNRDESRMKFLSKIERIFGVKMIAIDESIGQVIYGSITLDRLAK
jgi:hypothetical protein